MCVLMLDTEQLSPLNSMTDISDAAAAEKRHPLHGFVSAEASCWSTAEYIKRVYNRKLLHQQTRQPETGASVASSTAEHNANWW